MTKMLRDGVSLWAMIARAPEGEGTGGGEGGDKPATPPTPESVMFPDEKKPEEKAPEVEGEKKPETPAGDWKEYEVDPAKSEAENAAAKAEHDKTKPADDKDKKPDPLDIVPEDGKYSLTMPEGVDVDQELLDAVAPKFAAKKLTTREAQEIADEFIKVGKAREEARMKSWGETIQKWADDAKADKDIGGAKWDATVSDAKRAVAKLGTPALREYLNATGGGNHPELIRFMAKVGGMVKEDNPAAGGAGGSGKPADPAHVLFPSDAPKG